MNGKTRSVSGQSKKKTLGNPRAFSHRQSFPRTQRTARDDDDKMKTRIACYFDVPRPDNRQDDINWVDVRARTHRSISPSTITLDRFVSHTHHRARRRPTDILRPSARPRST
jgi:hypothetical protein